MGMGVSPERDDRKDNETKLNDPFGPSDGAFYDYSTLDGSFAENYLNQYYRQNREVPSDEHIVFDHLEPFLRANHSGGTFLDAATGPTIHHELFVSPYFDRISCADYLTDNRKAVEAFVLDRPDAVRWEHYAKFYLEKRGEEATSERIAALIEDARTKIGSAIYKSNLMQSPVVEGGSLYDAVGCFYCLEEVAKTEEDLIQILKNVAQHIPPGGAFMASCLAESNFYLLEEEDGNKIRIPCLWMDTERLSKAIESAGLEIPYGGITLKYTENQAEEGLPGILVAYAQKPLS
jgi:hypothetical protein